MKCASLIGSESAWKDNQNQSKTPWSTFPDPPLSQASKDAPPYMLVPKRSVLAGLVKSLAVGCGLNEFLPSANIKSSILADSMAVYLKPQTSHLKPAPPTPSHDEQNSGGGSPGSRSDRPGRSCSDKPSAEPARSCPNTRRVSRVSCPP